VRELTAQERAALALWLLLQYPMTTRELAERVELSMRGTRHLLSKLSRVVPLCYESRHWWVESHNETE